jgi:hypothetical protein
MSVMIFHFLCILKHVGRILSNFHSNPGTPANLQQLGGIAAGNSNFKVTPAADQGHGMMGLAIRVCAVNALDPV